MVCKNVDDSGWLRVTVCVMLVSRRLRGSSQISVEHQGRQERTSSLACRAEMTPPRSSARGGGDFMESASSPSLLCFHGDISLLASTCIMPSHTRDSHGPSPAFRSHPPPTTPPHLRCRSHATAARFVCMPVASYYNPQHPVSAVWGAPSHYALFPSFTPPLLSFFFP